MGKGLGEILGGVKEAEAEAKAKELAAEEQARAEISELQRQIIAGEGSSGNVLHDGIIALYGSRVTPGIVANYESIAARLDSVGLYEPVVVIRNWLEDAEHISFPSHGREPRQALHRSLIMGTLKDRSFIFDYAKQRAYLPTALYTGTPDSGEDLNVSGGNILVDDINYFSPFRSPRLGYDLNQPIDTNVPMFIRPFSDDIVRAMEILVGYKHIEKWLSTKGQYSGDRDYEFVTFRKLAKELQIKTIEPVTKRQRDILERRMGL